MACFLSNNNNHCKKCPPSKVLNKNIKTIVHESQTSCTSQLLYTLQQSKAQSFKKDTPPKSSRFTANPVSSLRTSEQSDGIPLFQFWCQALHIVLQYFMVANYMWMFCEGLHLHLALVVVFVRDEVTMKWFFALGWIVPLILVSTYSIVRITVTKDTEL